MNDLLSKRFTELRAIALGGGTGLPVVLRSLKRVLFPPSPEFFSENSKDRLTAIVTITDDGGSSGRIRRDFDILPPGDIRNCLSVLSDDKTLAPDLFQYRFKKGDGLIGHSLGNLLLTALTDLKGNFMEAIQYCSKILGVKGQILPFTSMKVNLIARYVILNKGKVSSDLQKTYIDQNSYPVSYKKDEIRDLGLTSIMADLVSEKGNKIRHDEDKLGRLLMELI